MVTVTEERFKIIRRNSLRNEVDGFFEELDDFEDRRESTNKITHQECVMLNRVLSDKSKLPPVCVPSSSKSTLPQALNLMSTPAESTALEGIVRRLTNVVPEALGSLRSYETKRELGGIVTEQQCRTLAEYLTPSVGGLYLLPGACSSMLNVHGSDGGMPEQHEENAEVYNRPRKHPSLMDQTDYPPSMF